MPVNGNAGNTAFACIVIGQGIEAARLSLSRVARNRGWYGSLSCHA